MKFLFLAQVNPAHNLKGAIWNEKLGLVRKKKRIDGLRTSVRG
jgi:hypothetical protein